MVMTVIVCNMKIDIVRAFMPNVFWQLKKIKENQNSDPKMVTHTSFKRLCVNTSRVLISLNTNSVYFEFTVQK